MRRRPSGVNGILNAIRLNGFLAATTVVLAAAVFSPGCGPQADDGDADPAADTTAAAASDERDREGLGEPVLVVDSLAMPESAAPGPDGRWYVSLIGEFGKDEDGAIAVVDPASGAVDTIATELDDPKGIAFKGDTLYVADVGGVFKVAPDGTVSVLAGAFTFPRKPQLLNDVVFDAEGNLLVSDTGSLEGKGGGAIFRISPAGDVAVLAGSDTIPDLGSPNGLAFGPGGIYAVDFTSGALYVTDGNGAWRKVVDGLGAGDGLALDAFGRLYVTDHNGGTVLLLSNIAGPGNPFGPYTVASGIEGAADLAIDAEKGRLVVPALRGNRLLAFELP